MKNKIFSLLTIALMPAALLAQDDKNLVKNPGFEATTGKFKRNGNIAMAKEWKAPTLANADLYSVTSKDPLTQTKNLYGKEDPQEGNNFVGMLMFSFGDKAPRTYISSELIGPLKDGVQYCVSFDISLADNSLYAITNIGAYLHKREMAADNKGNLTEGIADVVKHPKNKIITQSFGWEKVCNVFTAKGGEKYITIGNFNSSKDTKFEKRKKGKGVTEAQQPYGYYYIDNIRVFQLDSIQECQCDVEKKEKANVVYSEEFGSNKEFTPEEKVAQNKVHFDNMSSIIKEDNIDHLNKIIEVLNAHPELKLEVIAHCDKSEYAKIEVDDRAKDLTPNRAKAVVDFLVKAGIAKERITTTVKNDQEPMSSDLSELGMAKNRRVEFKASK